MQAVRGVSFQVPAGEIFGLVGETGSGKSTVARCVAGLTRPTSGAIVWRGRDLSQLKPDGWRQIRKELQIVAQNPSASLDPRWSIGKIVAEPLENFGSAPRRERADRVAAALGEVGLTTAELKKRPWQLSGGQRQRVALARALILQPRLLILDEPVSALDVSIQAQVVKLLLELQRSRDVSLLVILHDLAVARQLCDRVGVMFAGRIVEIGPADAVIEKPAHPYTRALIEAAPTFAARGAANGSKGAAPGYVPSSAGEAFVKGCRYRGRCPVYRGRSMCEGEDPELRPVVSGASLVACHFAVAQ